MDSHHRALLHRALATAAVVATAGTTMLAGTGRAGAHEADECRAYSPYTAHPFVKIVAEDNAFDTDCLKAPPDRGFRIYLQNQDRDTPHNLSIYSADPAKDKKATQLFKGSSVKGLTQEEYSVDALPAGTYYFQDDKTTTMKGQVQIPKKK